jgi:hypothetical protein
MAGVFGHKIAADTATLECRCKHPTSPVMLAPGEPQIAVDNRRPLRKDVGGAAKKLNRRHRTKIRRSPLQKVRTQIHRHWRSLSCRFSRSRDLRRSFQIRLPRIAPS